MDCFQTKKAMTAAVATATITPMLMPTIAGVPRLSPLESGEDVVADAELFLGPAAANAGGRPLDDADESATALSPPAAPPAGPVAIVPLPGSEGM